MVRLKGAASATHPGIWHVNATTPSALRVTPSATWPGIALKICVALSADLLSTRPLTAPSWYCRPASHCEENDTQEEPSTPGNLDEPEVPENPDRPESQDPNGFEAPVKMQQTSLVLPQIPSLQKTNLSLN